MTDSDNRQVIDDELNHRRMVEAVLFASEHPLTMDDIKERLPNDADVEGHLESLMEEYANKGVNLKLVSGKYMFSTASDLAFLLRKEVDDQRTLSRAAVETLAIIAYHFPVTRAEVEEIRGVGLSKGTLDTLMEAGWVRMMGRRKTPGRPVTYGITDDFLVHFGLETIKDLPGLNELKAAGLLDTVDEALEKLGREAKKAEEDQIDLEDAIEAKTVEEDDAFDGDESDDYVDDDDWSDAEETSVSKDA